MVKCRVVVELSDVCRRSMDVDDPSFETRDGLLYVCCSTNAAVMVLPINRLLMVTKERID